MFDRNRKFKRAAAALVLFISFGASAQTTFPTIVVTGDAMDGGTIGCAGGPCANALNQQTLQQFLAWQAKYDSIPPEDPLINRDQFCRKLEAAQPPSCSLSSPPPSPGISIAGQPSWQANGCGTGGMGTWFQDFILEVVSSDSYSGDIHAPYGGVSFRAACDAHDSCWAAGGSRATCDNAFRTSTLGACGAVSDPGGKNTCNGFAGLYHGAVSTTDGSHNAYAGSVAERTCALWALDMRENQCDD